ncbi:hypothetical protein IQ265_26450 [Nodosilinea sp. LEGE 06152]|uniref:hypothetical protein n=1 Tax=Nodosilinea sp. LEGE 06152 TaxID=2777966 RepID=UPI0018814244|nr:hypothetical protein [Nodosilinea sp. LEGE 06152]MBE9160333.1 hypothetical protein [Nodosilinea sp. LEGE 06152]
MALQQVVLMICGGMHPPSYTGQMLATIAQDEVLQLSSVVCAPHGSLEVLSPFALRQTLAAHINSIKTGVTLAGPALEAEPPALVLWAFSAGCVGAAALATYWQRQRGPVLALFMVDGWGVPRDPEVPTYRLSHDATTHYTSRWLGAGDVDFYADPAVPHLTLWRQPQAVAGWAVEKGKPSERLTAADFLCRRSRAAIHRYSTSC